MQSSPKWASFVALDDFQPGREWLTVQSNLGLAENTVLAYARALSDFLQFCRRQDKAPLRPGLEGISLYVRYLNGGSDLATNDVGAGPALSNATIQQRLTDLRLFYDFLIEQGLLQTTRLGGDIIA